MLWAELRVELDCVVCEVHLDVGLSDPWNSENKFIVPEAGDQCGDFFFMVANGAWNLYSMSDVPRCDWSAIDNVNCAGNVQLVLE